MKRLGMDRFSGLYLWAAFIVVFSILAPRSFPTMPTVHLLASTQAVAGLAALALLVPMACGQFDLSIGSTANLAGMVAVMVQTKNIVGPIPAFLLGVCTGLVVGFVNGFVVVKLGVSSFIATLGMGSILVAIQVIITGNVDPMPVQNDLWNNLTQTKIFGFQMVVVYLVVVALIMWWVLTKTPAGRYLYASGSNPEAARLTGINVDRWSWIALTTSGGISGLAGVLFVSLTGPSLGFGSSLLLPAFAAVFFGATQLHRGRPNVWGTLIAIFVLATGAQGLQLTTGEQWVAPMFNGVALLAAVALAAGKGKSLFVRRPGRARSNGSSDPRGDDPASEPERPLAHA